jgi:allantoinase
VCSSDLTVDGLWQCLAAGGIDSIGSDHSPSPPELKEGNDFFSMWGGIAGCQHGFPLLIERALRESSWQQLAALLGANPARRFGLGSRKGRLAAGFDADFCLLTPEEFVIERKDLLSRHPISPYVGMRSGWRVAATWLRGNPVSPATHGRFLSPE